MEANSRNFREVEAVQLSDCISSIDASLDLVAVGCVDDNLYVW